MEKRTVNEARCSHSMPVGLQDCGPTHIFSMWWRHLNRKGLCPKKKYESERVGLKRD